MYRLSKYTDTVMGLVRILIGLFLIYHGSEIFKSDVMAEYPKMQALSGTGGLVFAYIGKAFELIAGIFLTLGFFTRWAALLVIVTFLAITFFIGDGRFWYQEQHPFMFVVVGIIFFFYGSGRFALDTRERKINKTPEYGNF